jgi:zinc transporter ZupT
MIHAALLAGFSAILGGAIALVARQRPGILERVRTFAFAAAAGVVAFHLLPEVLPSQGLVALLWMATGFALPWLLEWAARTFGPDLLRGRGLSSQRVSAEVGFAALIFHSVAEGLALVAALAQPRGNLDLETAIVAHHAPLTAAVVLPFLDMRGPRAATLRAALVGAAGIAGALLSFALPGFEEGAFLKTTTAVTAGALLHVVSDEIRAQRFGSRLERALDLGACAAGLAVAGFGALMHLRDEAPPLIELLRVIAGISLASAPAILVGCAAGALLASRSRFFRWDAFLLLLVLLGPAAAMGWAALTILLALPAARSFRVDAPARPVGTEILAAVRTRAPALLALLMAAAGLEVSTRTFPGALVPAAALVAVVVLAARLDEAGAVAVTAVLIRKGLDPAIAVALLAIGPLTRTGLLRALAGGRRAVGIAIAAGGGALALVAGWLLSISGLLATAPAAVEQAMRGVRDPLAVQAASSPIGVAAALILAGLAVATLWSQGVRGWFAPLRHGPRTV